MMKEKTQAGPEYPAGTVLIDGLPYTEFPDGSLKARFSVYPDGTIHPHLKITVVDDEQENNQAE
jgi:hypothetical protein